jgi:UDP-hydrolysing UDP-N-acetyl-D-glucosamine 2-epimerase
MKRPELEAAFGLDLRKPPLLVTYHPVTLEYEQAGTQIDNLLKALKDSGFPVVFTLPNADTAGSLIAERMRAFLKDYPSARLVPNLGTRGYFSLMRLALAMVGNSSSGLIEAPYLSLPVVNVGNRQKGRLRGKNVIDVGTDRAEILRGIERAVEPAFRKSLFPHANPYGKGQAAQRILRRIKNIPITQRLLVKKFVDFPWGKGAGGR